MNRETEIAAQRSRLKDLREDINTLFEQRAELEQDIALKMIQIARVRRQLLILDDKEMS